MCQDIVEDESNNIQSIALKFLESGHSESEVDSIHATLEKAEDGISIYLPSDYITITELARKNQKYVVYMLGTNDCPVYDLKKLSAARMRNTRDYVDSDGKLQKVNWLKAKIIYVGREVSKYYISHEHLSL